MATEVSYNGTGSQTTFNITFPYITSTDVKVSVGGTTQSTSAYTVNASNQVVFNTAPASGTSNVRLFRVTDITQALATYTVGSAISAQDLNDNQLQVLYSLQEADTVTASGVGLPLTATSKGDIAVNATNDWVINTNAVEKSMMADNSVGTSEIETNAVTANELADNAVDTNAIVANAVTLAKLATATLTSIQTTYSNPVGTVIWYAGTSAPGGYLKCNGDAIANGSGTTQSITADFSALYAVVGANLPDLRGEFVRGWDDGKGTDSGRSIRSTQTDQNKQHNHSATSSSAVTDPGHTHTWSRQDSQNDANYRPWPASNNDVAENVVNTGSNTTGISVATTTTIANEGGTDARPRNVALLACIKY
tara:strand:+ start:7629 stop:8723 length:1095 start_codon:yes stop_codon:yes gene_type:complete